MDTNKKILGVIIVAAGLICGSLVMAEEKTRQEAAPDEGQARLNEIAFPIAELGGCLSREECKAYCDESDHVDACLAFAEARGLMSAAELAAAKKFVGVGLAGPGGCQGKDACAEYCDAAKNIEACVAFAEQNDLMSDEKLQESKKVVTAIKNDVKPPRCSGQEDCDHYCASEAGMEECITFGTDVGILPIQEQENARKVLTAIKNGAVPPCRGKECEATCNSVGSEACRAFADAAGIYSRGKMIMIQRILTSLAEEIHPSGCSTEQECQDYCAQDANLEECLKFAETVGGLTSAEATAARENKDVPPEGPGGCQSKEECDAFCGEPKNSGTCFDFAKDHGMISEADLMKIEEKQQKLKGALNDMPEVVAACLDTALGTAIVEQLKSGSLVPGPIIGEKIKFCLSQSMPQDQSGLESGQPGEPGQPPSPPSQPPPPNEPSGGGCGDGKCGSAERADPTLCPEDCSGTTGEPQQPPPPPSSSGDSTQPPPPPSGGSGRGGTPPPPFSP